MLERPEWLGLWLLGIAGLLAVPAISAGPGRPVRPFRFPGQRRRDRERHAIGQRVAALGRLATLVVGQREIRVGRLASRLAMQVGLDPAEVEALEIAAPLHDIGRISVPDAILEKPGPLDEAELQVMRRHPEIGARILSNSRLPVLDLAAELALCHHERWDGGGYPRGLAGEDIPLGARIVAVANSFDALLSGRPYRQRWPLEQVVDHLRYESGRHFDPRLTYLLLDDLPAMLAIRREETPEAETRGEAGRRSSNALADALLRHLPAKGLRPI